MKKIGIIIFIVFIVITLSLYLVAFQVRDTESCLVTTFGKPTRSLVEPGVHFKWPFPIQQVYKFDSRMRVFAPEVEETTTAGGEPIIVSTHVVWRISDPLDFFNAVKTVNRAEDELLRSRIRNTQNNVIGRHDFSEFVNSDPNKMKFEEIEAEMLTDLRQSVADAEYGIEIETLGMKQLKVSEEVSKEVFERMKSDRNRRAEETISAGTVAANKIRTDADRMSKELIAAAEARAKIIRGIGDAEAAKYYEMLQTAPELAMFLRNLEALEKSMSDRTTVIVPTDKEPFTYLQKMPEIKSGSEKEK
jgi:membrane protease subunit HflC